MSFLYRKQQGTSTAYNTDPSSGDAQVKPEISPLLGAPHSTSPNHSHHANSDHHPTNNTLATMEGARISPSNSSTSTKVNTKTRQQVPTRTSSSSRVREFAFWKNRWMRFRLPLLPFHQGRSNNNNNNTNRAVPWQYWVDATMDAGGWMLERTVYLIGPILIVLALAIITLLTYTFFSLLIPMWLDKYRHDPLWYGQLLIALHTTVVIFLLGNILFNYLYCVITPHHGSEYKAVVRELATATGFVYPETPDEIAMFRRDFEDKMVFRIRRQHVRAMERQQKHQASIPQPQQQVSQSKQGVTLQRRHDGSNTANSMSSDGSSQPSLASVPMGNSMSSSNGTTDTSSPKKSPEVTQKVPPSPPVTPPQPQPQFRSWMLLGPYEWGFCGRSNLPKPPRSHYDQVTKQLILNLDHYCPWMFNSIGYFNYRYFVTFLLYVLLGMFYGALITMEPFLLLGTDDYKRQYRMDRHPPDVGSGSTTSTYTLSRQNPPARIKPMLPFTHERMLLSISFMLCVAVGLAVMLLGGFHAYLVCSGQTTIEFHANWTMRRRNPKHRNPYSQGSWRKNFAQVFGSCYATSNSSSTTKNKPRWLLSAFAPSRRTPDVFPVPLPGQDNRRKVNATDSSSPTGNSKDATWIV